MNYTIKFKEDDGSFDYLEAHESLAEAAKKYAEEHGEQEEAFCELRISIEKLLRDFPYLEQDFRKETGREVDFYNIEDFRILEGMAYPI